MLGSARAIPKKLNLGVDRYMTWEPRAAIKDIEQEIGLLRNLIVERE
jgi:hypothetical protein